MKENIVSMLVCPSCKGGIRIKAVDEKGENDEIKEGFLVCNGCERKIVIKNYIPRFILSDTNYTESFGYQWNIFDKTQIDDHSGITMTKDRFFYVTKWNENLAGEKILEAGCGAGRFTNIVKRTNAEVFSFDYSNAVDANMKTNGLGKDINYFQANIFEIPFKEGTFDKIYCFGVLQHTPDPYKAFKSLIPYLKPGGKIAVDVYDLTFRALVNPKYWLRPVTKKIPNATLYKIVKKIVPLIFPIKMWVTEKIFFGKYFAFFIPIAYHKGFIPTADDLTYDQLVEWSILDTFDKYSPEYDKPQTIGTVKNWFKVAGLKNAEISYGPNGINGIGEK